MPNAAQPPRDLTVVCQTLGELDHFQCPMCGLLDRALRRSMCWGFIIGGHTHFGAGGNARIFARLVMDVGVGRVVVYCGAAVNTGAAV